MPTATKSGIVRVTVNGVTTDVFMAQPDLAIAAAPAAAKAAEPMVARLPVAVAAGAFSKKVVEDAAVWE